MGQVGKVGQRLCHKDFAAEVVDSVGPDD